MKWKDWLILITILILLFVANKYLHLFLFVLIIFTLTLAILSGLGIFWFLRRGYIRSFICLCLVVMLLFLLGWHNLYRDIPFFFSKEFNTIEGKATYISSVSTDDFVQEIEINGFVLNNYYTNLDPKIENRRELKVNYLPNSRFIIDIWEYK